jgi:hypothetical protein
VPALASLTSVRLACAPMALDGRPTLGQHLLHRDLDAVALMGREIGPALAG